MPSLEDVVKIIYDDKTLQLAAKLKAFDPFRILKIDRYEIRHANTLAWLLDPTGNHGFEETFLRAFAARLSPNQEGQSLAHLLELAVDPTIVIRREVRLKVLQKAISESASLTYESEPDEDPHVSKKVSKRSKDGALDILMEGEDWVLVIEAKLHSGEGFQQLDRYRQALDQYARGKKRFFIYLTIEGEEPSNSLWTSVNWREHVIDPLETTLAIRTDLKSEVRYFLCSSLEALRRQNGSGQVDALASEISSQFQQELIFLKEQCRQPRPDESSTGNAFKRIFDRHEQLFGALFSQLSSPTKVRAEHYRLELKKHGFKDYSQSDTYMRFIPSEWEERFPKTFRSFSKLDKSPLVAFELSNRPPRIGIKLMTPSLATTATDDQAESRRKLVKLVQAGGRVDLFNLAFYKVQLGDRSQPKKPTDSYFCIFGRSREIGIDENYHEADVFIDDTLKWIRTNLLPELEALMKRSGFA